MEVAQWLPNLSAISKARMITFYSVQSHWITKKYVWLSPENMLDMRQNLFKRKREQQALQESKAWPYPAGRVAWLPPCEEWQDHPSSLSLIEERRRVPLKEESPNPSNNPLSSQSCQKITLILQRISIQTKTHWRNFQMLLILLPKIKNPPDMENGKHKISVLMFKSHVL